MKRYILMFALLFPFIVLAQTPDPILTPPEDTGMFISWFFSSVKTLSGASATLIIAFILTVMIGLFKLTPLKSLWDKLGKWKFVIPLALGAIVEIIMNLPKPFTWGAFIGQLIAGAFGTGTVAIALKTIWTQLFPPKVV